MKEHISELNPLAIFYDGFDEAIIGIDDRECRVVYDYIKIIDILMREMTYEEALDYYSYNIASMYVGPSTPIILNTLN